jgi:Terminase large subunit, T4likevirus-type, N-terminal/Terminase RNaseH-like domain
MPRIQLPKPHETQQLLLEQARRYNVVALGRRAGKSTLAQHVLVVRALQRAEPVGYFAPTYKLLAEFWRDVRNVLQVVTVQKSEQDHRVEMLGGGVLECWSLDDPNPARGRKYGLIVVDEAAMVRELLEIWQLALRPTLTDLAGGAWFMSTPRGLNDFWSLYQQGQDPLQTDWASWQMPTSVNPFISPLELDAARADLPERAWAQEYLAEFIQLEGGGVFRGVDAVSRLQPAVPQRGHQYVIGVDWGRTNDFTAICVMDASTCEQVALDRFSEIDYELQTERLHRWCNAYHPVLVVAESNAMGRPLVERLQTGYARLLGAPRKALPVWAWEATNASKAALVQMLGLALERGDVTLLDDPVQRAELLSYEAAVLPSGMIRYGAPGGMHDDTVIALGLAYLGAMRESVPTGVSRYSFGGGQRALPSARRRSYAFRGPG